MTTVKRKFTGFIFLNKEFYSLNLIKSKIFRTLIIRRKNVFPSMHNLESKLLNLIVYNSPAAINPINMLMHHLLNCSH